MRLLQPAIDIIHSPQSQLAPSHERIIHAPGTKPIDQVIHNFRPTRHY